MGAESEPEMIEYVASNMVGNLDALGWRVRFAVSDLLHSENRDEGVRQHSTSTLTTSNTQVQYG